MSLVDILAWASILLAVLSALVAFGVHRKIDKFEQTKKVVGINSTRADLENQIYQIQQQLLDDTYNFVDTNKLLIKYASDNPFSTPIPNYSFFDSMGITISGIQEVANQAFCLMPFNKKYDTQYAIIKDACLAEGVKCVRSDEFYEPGNLLKQIIQLVIESRYIFAVLDGRNPNVFYEIGIAHAIGKPVFLIARNEEKEKLPFDLKSARLIIYKNNKDLEDHIRNVIVLYKEDGFRDQTENSGKID